MPMRHEGHWPEGNDIEHVDVGAFLHVVWNHVMWNHAIPIQGPVLAGTLP